MYCLHSHIKISPVALFHILISNWHANIVHMLLVGVTSKPEPVYPWLHLAFFNHVIIRTIITLHMITLQSSKFVRTYKSLSSWLGLGFRLGLNHEERDCPVFTYSFTLIVFYARSNISFWQLLYIHTNQS